MPISEKGQKPRFYSKITLYKEKEVVRRNVPEDEAVDALIDLIREHGDWVEAPAVDVTG